jgi:hypothetical protein
MMIALCCIGGVALGAGVSGKSLATLTQGQIKGMWYGSYTLPSPTFVLTGVVPVGATQLEIKRKGDEQTGSFMINTEKWSDFSLHFRLGYGNIGKGKNQYTLAFWEGKQLRGIGFLELETQFQEHSFDDVTIYMDENFSAQIGGEAGVLFPVGRATPSVLVKYGEQFTVLTGPVLYDEEKKLLYEGRDVRSISGSRLSYGDLYLNGKSLVTNVPVAFSDSGGGNSIQFSYQPQQNTLGIAW